MRLSATCSSDGNQDIEQALWFFECFADSGLKTAKICREINAEYLRILQWYEELNDLQLNSFTEKGHKSIVLPFSEQFD